MRDMSSDMLAALSTTPVYPIFFVQLQFLSSSLNVCSSPASVTWNGVTWSPLPGLIDLNLAEESSALENKEMELCFNGLDPIVLPLIQNYFLLGLPITIWFGCLTAAGSIIDSPYNIGTWRMDKPNVNIDITDLRLTLKADPKLIDMNVPQNYIYDNETQQSLPGCAGDLGFSFKNSLLSQTLYWGNIAGGFKV